MGVDLKWTPLSQCPSEFDRINSLCLSPKQMKIHGQVFETKLIGGKIHVNSQHKRGCTKSVNHTEQLFRGFSVKAREYFTAITGIT